ncbi:uncharacterized protein PAC_20038 [Phialocephala subalpina]|uniref:Ppe family protein n=1 Tax=Phialocephala subalpina TaxID=576137 RepID=A0A1L7XYN8_9HELO|nr:uncharacterized protein PAC_20038 [Phialocephala subalpina]
MKLQHVLFMFSVSGVLAYPIVQGGSVATVGSGSTGANFSTPANSTSVSSTAATNTTSDPNTAVDDIKGDAAFGAFGAFGGTKVNAASVKTASSNFATDANTVSASINKMGQTTDKNTIKSLATTAFNAESDEDAQRSVLAAAAGSAGKASNAKIVKNTPTVLDGLSAIMRNPASVKSNLQTIQNARNPQILPSITQLSNAALSAMGLPQTQQQFPATTA